MTVHFTNTVNQVVSFHLSSKNTLQSGYVRLFPLVFVVLFIPVLTVIRSELSRPNNTELGIRTLFVLIQFINPQRETEEWTGLPNSTFKQLEKL